MTLGENTRRLVLVGTAVAGLAALLLLAAAVVLPLLVPAAELRRAALAAVAGTTEQGVTVSGEPTLRLLPSPRVTLRKVTFSLPHDQSLEADAVVSHISVWPLLFGRIVVSEVTLESPTLVLTGERRAPELGIVPFLATPDGPELRVVDGTIAWRAEGGLTRELVSGIVGRFDRVTGGTGMNVSAVFDWRESTVEAHLSVEDVRAFLAGTLTPTRASLASNTANLRFRGQAGFATRLTADGTLSAEADSLRSWLDWVGLPAPTSRGLGAFSFTSHVAMEGHSLVLANTVVDLDGNRSEGGLLVKLSAPRPVVQGTFASDKLSLNPYGRMRLTGDNGREWDREPFDLSFLDKFDLDLRLSAAQVTAVDTTFTTVAASAVLANGRLVLALGQTSGWNGMLRGTATLAPRSAGRIGDPSGLTMRVEAECSDISLEQALGDLAGVTAFEGTGTLQFDLQGEGRNAQEIAQSLAGTVALNSDSGDIVGFDVAQLLRRIQRQPLSAAADPRGGRTPFTQLQVQASLRHGLATVETMAIDGGQVHLDMDGTIDVAQRSLDLSGEATLKSPPKGNESEGISLPFLVEGPWIAPRIMADPLSLIERSGAAQPLLEAVKSRKAGAAIHTMIEKLVKPVAPQPSDAAGTPAN